MAKVGVKTTWDGAVFELEDVDLEQITNRDLIQQMIDAGCMEPESQLPSAADNTLTAYSLIDKAGVRVEPDEVKTLAEIGFTDGDTIRIIITWWRGTVKQLKKYDVVFVDEKGNTILNQNLEEGSPISAPAAPNKPGFTFVDWIPSVPSTVGKSNLRFTPKYRLNIKPKEEKPKFTIKRKD